MQRAFTLLAEIYTEHAYAGRLLFQKREGVSVTYPASITGAVRSPRGAEVVETETPSEPTPPADPAPE